MILGHNKLSWPTMLCYHLRAYTFKYGVIVLPFLPWTFYLIDWTGKEPSLLINKTHKKSGPRFSEGISAPESNLTLKQRHTFFLSSPPQPKPPPTGLYSFLSQTKLAADGSRYVAHGEVARACSGHAPITADGSNQHGAAGGCHSGSSGVPLGAGQPQEPNDVHQCHRESLMWTLHGPG